MQIYNIYEKYKGLSTLEFEEDKKEEEITSANS